MNISGQRRRTVRDQAAQRGLSADALSPEKPPVAGLASEFMRLSSREAAYRSCALPCPRWMKAEGYAKSGIERFLAMKMTRRTATLRLGAAAFGAEKPRHGMRELTPADSVTIREEKDWYMHSVGVVALDNELVCTYRRSDEHIASGAEVWCTRSRDGGRTWTDHKMITRLGWDPDKASWIA